MSGSGFKKLTIKEAEKHIGGRLDRRRKYFLWNFSRLVGFFRCPDCVSRLHVVPKEALWTEIS